MELTPIPGVDQPGFCALCHIPIAVFDGPKLVGILPNFATIYPTLDNGSKLVVTTCRTCKDNFKCSDIPYLLESVYKGWVQSIELKGKANGNDVKEDLKALEDEYGPRFIISYDDKEIGREQIERELGELMVGAKDMAQARATKLERVSMEKLDGNNS